MTPSHDVQYVSSEFTKPSFESPTRIARLLHPYDVQQRPSTSFVNMAVLTSMVDGLVLVLTSRTGSLLAALSNFLFVAEDGPGMSSACQ